MNMVEFGYFFAVFLIAKVGAVHGYRLLRTHRALRTETGSAQTLSARYI